MPYHSAVLLILDPVVVYLVVFVCEVGVDALVPFNLSRLQHVLLVMVLVVGHDIHLRGVQLLLSEVGDLLTVVHQGSPIFCC